MAADDVDVAGCRGAQLDRIADLLVAHLDIEAVTGLLTGGPPARQSIASRLGG